VAEDEPGAFVRSASVITTSAEDALGHIHDRMPMLVERAGYDAWLDATATSTAHLLDVLVPAAPGRLEAYPVSTAVNSVRNNGPELVEPLPVEPEPGVLFGT
jgi:putative SOS response-associated peptidase YedK